MKRLLALLLLLLATLVSFQGCNTLQGAGQDVEEVGEEIDEEI